MAINNFCYMFERGKEKAASAPLYYVKNLYIKLYYTLDDVEYCLESNGDKIKLFRCPSETKIEFELSYTDSMDQTANIIDIVKPFFYTIVSNYSLQSFISSNYNQEIVAFNKTTKKDDFPENVDIYGITKQSQH